jgi:hypothetical protein
MTRSHESHRQSLPKPLQHAASELRSTGLPEGFRERLDAALVRADREAASARRLSGRAWTIGPWLALVPGAAGMALMLHLAVGNGTDEGADEMWHQVQAQELEVVLADAGHSWVSLDLHTHHHDGHHAFVRVEAPHDVEIQPVEHAEAHSGSPQCAAARCVHQFSQPTDAQDALNVRVSAPGRYDIAVEHESPAGRVRQRFVVHARR